MTARKMGPESLTWALQLACLVGLSLAGCAHRGRGGEPGVRLEIAGARQLEAAEIRQHLVTRPGSGAASFDEDAWRADLRRIERFYESRGYHSARVVEHDARLEDGVVRLFVRIDEGEPTRIRSVDLRWESEIPEQERARVLEEVPFAEGEVFREADWEGLRERLKLRLQDLGYAGAEVAGEVRVHPDSQQAAVELTLEPGPRYVFGDIVLARPLPTEIPAEKVVEQARVGAPEGAVFSRDALGAVQLRVYRIGVFSSVRVAPGQPDPRAGTVPILVDVEVGPIRTVRAGPGVRVDPSLNELGALGEYLDRDFLGGLRMLRLAGRVGWAFVPSAYSVLAGRRFEAPRSGPIARLSAELGQPGFLHPEVRLFAGLEGERAVASAFELSRGSGRAGAVWDPREDVTVTAALGVEVLALSAHAPLATPPELLGCARCALPFFEQRLEWDRRDDPLDPAQGFYLALRLREGFGPSTFVQLAPDLRGYWSPEGLPRLTLSGRLAGGALWQRTDAPSPMSLRFFGGGGSLMRGFGRGRLSPYLVLPTGEPGQGIAAPIGGNALLEAAIEGRYRFGEAWAVAGFVDTGAVGAPTGPWDFEGLPSGLQVAVGGGLRYRTPFGPLRLDLAYRLAGRPLPVYPFPGEVLTYPVQAGCFGLFAAGTGAGSPEGPCVLHLSFGEAF